uniref:Uncharacterized protein n=1 Tax=Cannabis sativa TaxID=3483 RepID=A0A803Q946_CANSA
MVKTNKEIKELKDKVTALQLEVVEEKKKSYDQGLKDYIYTTLTSVPSFDFVVFIQEVVDMANTFCTMSPTKTQGVVGTPFLENTNPTVKASRERSS